jgi:hypothetical protein
MVILNIICILLYNGLLVVKISKYVLLMPRKHNFLSAREEEQKEDTQMFYLWTGGSNDMQMKILSIKTKNQIGLRDWTVDACLADFSQFCPSTELLSSTYSKFDAESK